ncbi:MAG: hypothetical protein JNL87_13860 [Burkholderiaceae bacterium]|nr:hypothetical protein [Burkholderiaceae bacterium]
MPGTAMGLRCSQFIAPRNENVRVGELTDFHESELSGTTEMFGNVAHRFSAYTKSETLKGSRFSARGMISTQFIHTPRGWTVSSMAWDDERPGLQIAGFASTHRAPGKLIAERMICAHHEAAHLGPGPLGV